MDSKSADDLLTILRDLVAIDSSHPTSTHEIVEYLEREFDSLGFKTERLATLGNKSNLIATIGTRLVPLLGLVCNIETPPVDAWSEGLKLERKGDKLVGRGVAGNKAALATTLELLRTCVRENPLLSLQVVITYNLHEGPFGAEEIIRQHPDFIWAKNIVVLGPTNTKVMYASKGYGALDYNFTSSQPGYVKLLKIVTMLDDIQKHLLAEPRYFDGLHNALQEFGGVHSVFNYVMAESCTARTQIQSMVTLRISDDVKLQTMYDQIIHDLQLRYMDLDFRLQYESGECTLRVTGQGGHGAQTKAHSALLGVARFYDELTAVGKEPNILSINDHDESLALRLQVEYRAVPGQTKLLQDILFRVADEVGAEYDHLGFCEGHYINPNTIHVRALMNAIATTGIRPQLAVSLAASEASPISALRSTIYWGPGDTHQVNLPIDETASLSGLLKWQAMLTNLIMARAVEKTDFSDPRISSQDGQLAKIGKQTACQLLCVVGVRLAEVVRNWYPDATIIVLGHCAFAEFVIRALEDYQLQSMRRVVFIGNEQDADFLLWREALEPTGTCIFLPIDDRAVVTSDSQRNDIIARLVKGIPQAWLADTNKGQTYYYYPDVSDNASFSSKNIDLVAHATAISIVLEPTEWPLYLSLLHAYPRDAWPTSFQPDWLATLEFAEMVRAIHPSTTLNFIIPGKSVGPWLLSNHSNVEDVWTAHNGWSVTVQHDSIGARIRLDNRQVDTDSNFFLTIDDLFATLCRQGIFVHSVEMAAYEPVWLAIEQIRRFYYGDAANVVADIAQLSSGSVLISANSPTGFALAVQHAGSELQYAQAVTVVGSRIQNGTFCLFWAMLEVILKSRPRVLRYIAIKEVPNTYRQWTDWRRAVGAFSETIAVCLFPHETIDYAKSWSLGMSGEALHAIKYAGLLEASGAFPTHDIGELMVYSSRINDLMGGWPARQEVGPGGNEFEPAHNYASLMNLVFSNLGSIRPKCTIFMPVHSLEVESIVQTSLDTVMLACEGLSSVEVVVWISSKLQSQRENADSADQQILLKEFVQSFFHRTVRGRIRVYVVTKLDSQSMNLNGVRAEAMLAIAQHALQQKYDADHPVFWIDGDAMMNSAICLTYSDDVRGSVGRLIQANQNQTIPFIHARPGYGIDADDRPSTYLSDPADGVAYLYALTKHEMWSMLDNLDSRGYVEEYGLLFSLRIYLQLGGVSTRDHLIGEAKSLVMRARQFYGDGERLCYYVDATAVHVSGRRIAALARLGYSPERIAQMDANARYMTYTDIREEEHARLTTSFSMDEAYLWRMVLTMVSEQQKHNPGKSVLTADQFAKLRRACLRISQRFSTEPTQKL